MGRLFIDWVNNRSVLMYHNLRKQDFFVTVFILFFHNIESLPKNLTIEISFLLQKHECSNFKEAEREINYPMVNGNCQKEDRVKPFAINPVL